MARRALITGITGQDGSYLAEHLLSEGYEVWGLVRGQANPRVPRVRRLLQDVRLVRGDLLDQGSLISAVEKVQPDEVYNLGAISFVPMSWEQAELTAEVTGMGVLRVLEAIRVCSGITASRGSSAGQIRFYQASSSEMFGQVRETPQTERTPSTPGRRTAWPRRTGTSSRRTTASRTGCSRCRASCSTTSRPGGGRVRHPQGLARGRADQARHGRGTASGQP
ncbi:hypothetical protein GCM10027612_78560 [Microbispora bryophytorum subsp. camponoti]